MTRTCRLSVLALALAVSAVTPAVADTYLVYSQGGIPQGSNFIRFCLEDPNGGTPCDPSGEVFPACATPEGGSYQDYGAGYDFDNSLDGFSGWGVSLPLGVDLTGYAGDLRLFVSLDPPTGNHAVKVEFVCNPVSETFPVSYTTFISAHGWQANNSWQEIVIPVVDASFSAFDVTDPGIPVPIVRALDTDCLENVTQPFKVTLEGVDDVTIFANMWVDFVRWESANSHSGASSVEVQGRQLLVDGKPFVVNAVAYAPVAIGENWQGAWRDRPDRYNVDFPLMADMGVNAVRLYAPVLTTAMLDAAAAAGLYVIPTFGVDSIQLECAAGKSFMEDRFVDMVNRWKDHPAILFWLIGNEVNLNLTAGADLCTDFYPQLDSMALAAQNAGSSHPVGTAVAGMADVCSACSDDIDLPNVDFWGVQLYLGCDFGTAFAEYDAKPDCDRPLILTEFGVDAFHQPNAGGGSEDQTIQANCLDTLLDDAHQNLAVRTPGGVSSGQTIFEWADEWWKTNCQGISQWFNHDTCNPGTNPGFPDTRVHEEWFGIVGLNPGNPTDRPLRTAYTTVGDVWLGPVCNMQVAAFDPGTGNATIAFNEAKGNLDPVLGHDLHWGFLSNVSTPVYEGSLDLGPTSPSVVVTLPGGDLFWVVAGENSLSEDGCHGVDSAGAERLCSTGNCVPGWSCSCISP